MSNEVGSCTINREFKRVVITINFNDEEESKSFHDRVAAQLHATHTVTLTLRGERISSGLDS
jgi:hypothetical protein